MARIKTRTAHDVTVTQYGETFTIPAGSLVFADSENVSGTSHATRNGGGFDAWNVFHMDSGVRIDSVRVISTGTAA